ncbi:hypothetical protein F3Y22_tig00008013pilonHSYRG00197 [Hibiscus syriacus]|uniref:Uncharacterized protein n=1 Tax=Hibiscus syriacus TaxID=106335 RepID=A0A6A3CBE2_HIBSY|nr:hypothetical protein F3Y22_tig00008013pilonHSYRG00197 [Hibiscus syriacus]
MKYATDLLQVDSIAHDNIPDSGTNMPLVQASNTLSNFGRNIQFYSPHRCSDCRFIRRSLWTITVGSIFYELGLICITISAVLPSLRPPPCPTQINCQEASDFQLWVLYICLLLTSLGTGGIRPCVVTFAADQFESDKAMKGRSGKWSFFNWLAQVIVAAIKKRKEIAPQNPKLLYHNNELDSDITVHGRLVHTDQYQWLDKAAIVTESESANPNSPIYGDYFVIQQARTMDRHLSPSFEIPPASLSVFSILTMLSGLVLYERIFVPLARRFTGHPSGVTCLQRMGIGFVINIVATIISSLVETKRKSVAAHHNLLDDPRAIVPISVFWNLNRGKLDYYWLVSGIQVLNLIYYIFVAYFYTYKPLEEVKEEEEEEDGEFNGNKISEIGVELARTETA